LFYLVMLIGLFYFDRISAYSLIIAIVITEVVTTLSMYLKAVKSKFYE
jgi:Na+/H+ antiporter NhaA